MDGEEECDFFLRRNERSLSKKLILVEAYLGKCDKNHRNGTSNHVGRNISVSVTTIITGQQEREQSGRLQ